MKSTKCLQSITKKTYTLRQKILCLFRNSEKKRPNIKDRWAEESPLVCAFSKTSQDLGVSSAAETGT